MSETAIRVSINLYQYKYKYRTFLVKFEIFLSRYHAYIYQYIIHHLVYKLYISSEIDILSFVYVMYVRFIVNDESYHIIRSLQGHCHDEQSHCCFINLFKALETLNKQEAQRYFLIEKNQFR